MDEVPVNPITVSPGESQSGIDPTHLRPSRSDLIQLRLDKQLQLLQAGMKRWSAIKVNSDGVIIDGHHGVRAAAELGRNVDVLVVALPARQVGRLILELPIRGH